MTYGLLFRLEARPATAEDLARALQTTLARALEELPLAGWYTVRFGGTSFGVFAAFRDVDAEEGHVGDQVAAAIRVNVGELVDGTPGVESFDVLAGGIESRVAGRG
jgi:hypothetical protein